MTLSKDQKYALDIIQQWYKADTKKRNYITLGGYAGTGKTTLIAELKKSLEKDNKKIKIAFCSFTGKASIVLKNKLREVEALKPKDVVGTIHSLIYSPVVNSKEEIIGWEVKDDLKYDLIIVDEASMVDQNIWSDLNRFKIPIVAVGDHGQLPPIGTSFNLMQKPDLRLEKIHRQAEDNPIIKLATTAREKGEVDYGDFGYNVMKLKKSDADTREVITELIENFNDDTLLLCGYNTTRVKLNKYVRETKEFFTDEPKPGDRVVCLRNNHQKNIFNGMIGKIIYLEALENSDKAFAKIEMLDDAVTFEGTIYLPQFGHSKSINFTDERKKIGDADLFDFGYAVTVHKAQGSQAKRVILFEERFKQMDDEMWRRWLYTGITRASEELFIVG